ncbi:MAG: hypothetical protein DMH00_01460 [Acidobacteria bacterium]|nr:MAG: hypothetical protein DMH00_01460 [Acidobacteriota bacterium]
MSSLSAEERDRTAWEELFQDAGRVLGTSQPAARHLLVGLVREPAIGAAFLFRLSSRFHRRGWPFLSTLATRLNLAFHGCQIHCRARIGPGLLLPHPCGVVVGSGVEVGSEATLFQNVTLGTRSFLGGDYPRLGNQVMVFPNSVVIGSVRLGDGCRVGAGSVVLHDVPEGVTVAGAPASPLGRSAGQTLSEFSRGQ